MDRRELAEHLRRLPYKDLVAVLQDVFATHIPMPEETAYCRSRFFLGIASSSLESDEGEPERWEAWELATVAFPDPAHYGETLGPDWGPCQFGTCSGCGVSAYSNVKNGICSICGAPVYMT